MNRDNTIPPKGRTSSRFNSGCSCKKRNKQDNLAWDEDQYWARVVKERLKKPGQYIKVDSKDL